VRVPRALHSSSGTSTRPAASGYSANGASDLFELDGVVFFQGRTDATGAELWRSDGTSPGTVLVADITSGPGSSSPQWLRGSGALLFFPANDPVHGRELWRSDGTAAGTVLVLDVQRGARARRRQRSRT
jgi:ELWxxDGT repeat protein